MGKFNIEKERPDSEVKQGEMPMSKGFRDQYVVNGGYNKECFHKLREVNNRQTDTLVDLTVKSLDLANVEQDNFAISLEIIDNKLKQEFGEEFCGSRDLKVILQQVQTANPNFLKLYGYKGLRAYFSIDYQNDEIREGFLKHVVQYSNQEVIDGIFLKYEEFTSGTQNIKQELIKQFGDEAVEYAESISIEMRNQEIEFLESLGKFYHIETQFMEYKLGRLIVETEIFKRMFKNGNVSLEELKGKQFKIQTGAELLREPEIVDQMKRIYRENWKNYPEDTREALIESFENNLQNKNSRFYVLYHEGQTVVFNCFTTLENGEVYFSNFNVDSLYKSSQLGEAMMEISLDREMEQATIIASVLKDVPIKEKYLKDKGFEVIGEKTIGSVNFFVIKKELKTKTD